MQLKAVYPYTKVLLTLIATNDSVNDVSSKLKVKSRTIGCQFCHGFTLILIGYCKICNRVFKTQISESYFRNDKCKPKSTYCSINASKFMLFKIT